MQQLSARVADSLLFFLLMHLFMGVRAHVYVCACVCPQLHRDRWYDPQVDKSAADQNPQPLSAVRH